MMNYFAYASNLSRDWIKRRCPDGVPKFSATLPNYKLIFSGWSRQWRGGTATIQFSRGDKVRGAVYEISEADLRRLDQYEGKEYSHLNVTVFNEDGDAVPAVTYIKTGSQEEIKPAPEYLTVIQQGYKDWRIR